MMQKLRVSSMDMGAHTMRACAGWVNRCGPLTVASVLRQVRPWAGGRAGSLIRRSDVCAAGGNELPEDVRCGSIAHDPVGDGCVDPVSAIAECVIAFNAIPTAEGADTIASVAMALVLLKEAVAGGGRNAIGEVSGSTAIPHGATAADRDTLAIIGIRGGAVAVGRAGDDHVAVSGLYALPAVAVEAGVLHHAVGVAKQAAATVVGARAADHGTAAGEVESVASVARRGAVDQRVPVLPGSETGTTVPAR